MNRKGMRVLLAMVLGLLVLSAQAREIKRDMYIGLSNSGGSYRYSNTPIVAPTTSSAFLNDFILNFVQTVNPSVLQLRVGKQINPDLAVEFRYANGLSADGKERDFGGSGKATVEVKINNYLSFLAKWNYRMQAEKDSMKARFSPYGLMGISILDRTHGVIPKGSKNNPTPAKRTRIFKDTGFSYGIGLDIRLTERLSLNLESLQVIQTLNTDYKANGFGVTYTF